MGLAAFLPAAAWYRVIWGFSAQTAVQSGGVSDGLLSRLLCVFSPAYFAAGEEVRTTATETLSFFLRKGAHMTCYFILAALLLFGWSFFLSKRGKQVGVALLCCGLLAGLDEYHQTFVDGRSGTVTDVLVDLTGATVAVVLWLVLRWIVTRERAGAVQWGYRVGLLILGTLLIAGIPTLLGGELGQKELWRLCARFLEGWRELPADAQESRLIGLSPVVAQVLHLVLCGLAGGLGAMSLWSAEKHHIVIALASTAVWSGLTAAFVKGSMLCGAGVAALGSCGCFMALWLTAIGLKDDTTQHRDW